MLLSVWYTKVYGDNIQGLKDLWKCVITKTMERMVGFTLLESPEYFTIPLPGGLDPTCPDLPTTFATGTSRPSTLIGLDHRSLVEVLSVMSLTLSRDFNITVSTRARPVSTMGVGDIQENVKRIVLVGASILKRVTPILIEEGYEVVDLCEPGWKISPESVTELENKVKQMASSSNTAFVLDLFGNSSFRATLFDGSTILPIKGAGGFHLPGEVGVCKEDIFARLVNAAKPVMDATGESLTVIVPPLPRYLHGPCCTNVAHCTNMGREGHKEMLLADTMGLRAILKRKTATISRGRHWVMDTCSAVHDPEQKTVAEKVEALRTAVAKDSVHLTADGYKNLARNIVVTVTKLQTLSTVSAASLFTGPARRNFWRGFSSPVGSALYKEPHSWAKVNRGRGHRFRTPYQRHPR
jgi:hypothetical protein